MDIEWVEPPWVNREPIEWPVLGEMFLAAVSAGDIAGEELWDFQVIEYEGSKWTCGNAGERIVWCARITPPRPMLIAYRDKTLSPEAAQQLVDMANDPNINRHEGRDLPVRDPLP